jgi:hypothetical protein
LKSDARDAPGHRQRSEAIAWPVRSYHEIASLRPQ